MFHSCVATVESILSYRLISNAFPEQQIYAVHMSGYLRYMGLAVPSGPMLSSLASLYKLNRASDLSCSFGAACTYGR